MARPRRRGCGQDGEIWASGAVRPAVGVRYGQGARPWGGGGAGSGGLAGEGGRITPPATPCHTRPAPSHLTILRPTQPACLQVRHDELTSAAATHARLHLRDFSGQDLAHLCWALARMDAQQEGLFPDLADQVGNGNNLHKYGKLISLHYNILVAHIKLSECLGPV